MLNKKLCAKVKMEENNRFDITSLGKQIANHDLQPLQLLMHGKAKES